MQAESAPTIGSERYTEFFYCNDFQARGPRVLLLAHTWRPAMRSHCGVDRPAFYRRQALPTEVTRYSNGYPWGWSYKLDELLLDEQRWLSQAELERLRAALHRECDEALRGVSLKTCPSGHPSAALPRHMGIHPHGG